mmetsp:Transcript_118788/g.371460  ORF Transcript_118788/g.371460 Transcript_118788/m.371460 type:complete len:206 (-) Transcript_118788:7-624(-)
MAVTGGTGEPAAPGGADAKAAGAGGRPPPLYFFGLPGSGKTHCGQLAERELGYAFHDGDAWLPEDLRESLRQGKGFTPEQRDRFAAAIAQQIGKVRAAEAAARGPDARPVAVAQGTFKRRHRDLIRDAHPDIVFVWVRAEDEVRVSRLRAGGNLVDTELGRRMALDFEPPSGDEAPLVPVVENDDGAGDAVLLRQLQAIAGGLAP